MTYKESFADALAKRVVSGYQEDFSEKEVQVGHNLLLVNRVSPCFVCGNATEFRDVTNELSVAVCSEECRQQSCVWTEHNAQGDLPGFQEVDGGGSIDKDLP